MTDVVLGVDIGTSSSKGVLVSLDGRVMATVVREHALSRPRPGHCEMHAGIWWEEFIAITRSLLATEPAHVVAVGISGMGPCVLLTDADDVPLRPAILYGVDTRSTAEVLALTERYGDETIRARGGSSLSAQSAGPKIAWIAEHEPDLFARARRLYMPSSWLVRRLTGSYVLDHHSASQCDPLYDISAEGWYEPCVRDICARLEMPPLRWSTEVAGQVSTDASALTGLPAGTPVLAGTIDAWAEAVSVGAHGVGDLMLMYGTTMFLVNTVDHLVTSANLWGTTGTYAGSRCLAAGMATSGAITGWLKNLFADAGYAELTTLAAESPPGSNGLLMLPYFAGERTPIADPLARGVIAGLTLTHNRGDLYRCALEATGFGVRHNLEHIEAAGGTVDRIVAVGGGTQGGLWAQIVSDITGREQAVPQHTIGASYGSAFMAAQSVSDASIQEWNPIRELVTPRRHDIYDDLYPEYLGLYESTVAITHALAGRQQH